MSGVEGSSIAQRNIPLRSPEILTRPPNPYFRFGPGEFPGFQCVFSGVADKGKVPVQSLASFGRAFPVNNDFIRKSSIGGFEVKSCEISVKEEQDDEKGQNILQPASRKVLKKKRTQITPKRKACEPQEPESADVAISNGLLGSSSCRYDSSLSLLTKKFLNLLLEARDGTLDLNKTAQELDVQKRRMYDITNVLEGIGLIEKSLKNMIRLKATHMSKPKEVDDYKAHLRDEVETLHKEEKRLDRLISERQDQLAAMLEDEKNKKWLHVTQEDITALPCFEDSNLVAIEAPHGTIVEVPDPNEDLEFPLQHCRMVLRSSMGPIRCYLISKHEGKLGSSDRIKQLEEMDLCVDDDGCHMDEMITTSHSNSQATDHLLEPSGGIVKIEPEHLDRGSDYWFLSDLGVSLEEIWTG